MKKLLSLSLLAACIGLVGLGNTSCKYDHALFQQTAPPIPALTNVTAHGELIVTPAHPAQYAVNPSLQQGIETAQNVTGAVVPQPYGAVVTGGLGVLSALLGLWAKIKSGRLRTTQTILHSVIAGVEAAGNATTKSAIQSHATAAGVQTLLEPIVQNVVKDSPGVIVPAAAQ